MSIIFSLFLQVLFELQAESCNLLNDVNQSEMYDLLQRRRKKSRLQMESGGVWSNNKSHQSHRRMGELVGNRSGFPPVVSQKCCLFGSWCNSCWFFSRLRNTTVYFSFLCCVFILYCVFVYIYIYKCINECEFRHVL